MQSGCKKISRQYLKEVVLALAFAGSAFILFSHGFLEGLS